MLIRRLDGPSKRMQIYPINTHKGIIITLADDGRVDKIMLVNDGLIVSEFKANTIVFPACFTMKDDKYLSVECLTLWEDAFEEVYEA